MLYNSKILMWLVIFLCLLCLPRLLNKRFPKLTVYAKIVAKRKDTNIRDGDSFTWYFITFECENGERKEFRVGGRTYGLLVEGDCGNLNFQGTKYLGFERI